MAEDERPLTEAERRARRARLAKIFGEVLPEQTRDDAEDAAERSTPGEDASEAWLRRQVPPHHG